MKHWHPAMGVACAVILCLSFVGTATAAPQQAAVAQMSAGAAAVEWQPVVASYDRLTLTVSGPGGAIFSREFQAGETPSFSVFDGGGQARPDGVYHYELRVVPRLDPVVREKLRAYRETGDRSILAELRRSGKLPSDVPVQSGSFSIKGGSVVDDSAAEAPTGKPGVQNRSGKAITNVTADDQVIPDDLIVQQSLCVGFDCVNNESFGFDTIRLKENNTRIKFEDTSTGTFPTNDWQLTANDSASGGASKFSIEDITGSRVPFTITAGASTNSIFVDSIGRVGFRTSTPVLDLHVNTSNTPALRLEQNNSGGFTAQTWDIGANEANFFIRDVTGGSLLSMRIRPGAPTSSLDIDSDGDVGINEVSADTVLHVKSRGANDGISIERGGSAQDTEFKFLNEIDVAKWTFQMDGDLPEDLFVFPGASSQDLNLQVNAAGTAFGNVGIGTNNPTSRLHVNGTFTATGTKNFAMVDPDNPDHSIFYASLEGPEAGTYYRGTAKTVAGKAVIELPRFFAKVTEAKGLTVQLTPVGGWSQLYVEERSPERLVVRVAEGGEVEFDYFVQGIRKGYSDFQVERPVRLDPQ